MNKTARHVFRLCVTAGNLRRPPRTTTLSCYSQSASLRYSSDSNGRTIRSTDYASSVTPSFTAEDDVILDVLCGATTSKDVFAAVREYRQSLKSRHCLQAIKVLDSNHRQKSITDPSIAKKWEFLQLCEVLVSDINSLDPNDAVLILKAFPSLGVPSTSIVSQALLQLTRKSFEDLRFDRLIELDYQLKMFRHSPLADAMRIAIPILCEIRLNNKMIDLSNVSQLCLALSFLRNKTGHDEAVKMVIDSLATKGLNINVRQSGKIFKYLSDLDDLPPSYEKLLRNLQQILTKGTPSLPFSSIKVLLRKVVKKVLSQNNLLFYNEEFVDACAKAIISEDHGFDQGVEVLYCLTVLSHTQIRLIDYLAAKCFENPLVLSKLPLSDVMVLVIGVANTDYKPIFWESMQEIILAKLHKIEYKNKLMELRFAVCLAVLDCFNVELMRHVFSEAFLNNQLQHDPIGTNWHLLLLYQSVKTLGSNYNGPLPPQHLIDAAIRANGPSVTDSNLLPILENAMGGPQYVTSNLKTKLGHHIDHVVVMRKGGYPVAMNSVLKVEEQKQVVYIEDLILPAESRVISIINLPASAYAVNSRRLKGTWSLLLKTIETHTGHTVIPINSLMWKELTNHEKTPYLMQAIRLKCEDLNASANSIDGQAAI